jgi:ribosomal protein S6E (S10)
MTMHPHPQVQLGLHSLKHMHPHPSRTKGKLGVMVHSYNPSYSKEEGERKRFKARPHKVSKTLSQK